MSFSHEPTSQPVDSQQDYSDQTSSCDALVKDILALMANYDEIWSGRASTLLNSLNPALEWLQQRDALELTSQTLCDHLTFQKVMELTDATVYPDMPSDIRAGIQDYVTSLPGFVKSDGYHQKRTTLEQHNYLAYYCKSQIKTGVVITG